MAKIGPILTSRVTYARVSRMKSRRRPTHERLLAGSAVPVQPTASRRPAQERKTKRKVKPIATRAQQRDVETERARGQHRQPTLDAATAKDVAKLLMSGVPFDSVLALCDNAYHAYLHASEDVDWTIRKMRSWALAWQRDPQLLAATSELNGAEWQDIDSERRLQIALDKHMAELAYFLYSHSYDGLMGRDVDKADHARDAIMEFLAAKGGDPDAPWMKHLKDLVDKIGSDSVVPMLTVPTVPAANGKQES